MVTRKNHSHKLIKARQRKISLPYSDAKPSEVTEVYWIYSIRKKGEYPKPTVRSGKWLIFVDKKDADEVWAKITKATEEGKFGDSSKVATAKPNPNATNPDTKVICVYTYDWADEKDVKRVREELRRLGITLRVLRRWALNLS